MGRFYRGFVDTQYSIGEMVRVVDDIMDIAEDPDHIGIISGSMELMGGREFEVVRYRDVNGHSIVSDGSFYWLDDWLEPVAKMQVPESAFDDLFE